MKNIRQKIDDHKAILRIQVLVLTIVLLTMNLGPIKVEAASTLNVENVDFTDFSNWRSGDYYWTNGKYTENSYRLCLKDYVTFTGTKYKVHVTNTAFHILIREMDSNKNFLRSNNLANGQEFVPGAGTKYLAISIYKIYGENSMSYEEYKNIFAQGFIAELCIVPSSTITQEQTDTTDNISIENNQDKAEVKESAYTDIEKIDLQDFSNWKSGCYNWTNGQYITMDTRLCLNNYVTYSREKYFVSISNKEYRLLIREMDDSMKFIKSYEFKDGASYTPSSSAVYLGISIYKTNETNVSYETYKKLFANGFAVGLNAEQDSADTTQESDISTSNNQTSSEIDVSGYYLPKDKVYAVMEHMLLNGETTARDVSAYHLSYYTFYNVVVPKLQKNYYVEMASGYRLTPTATVQGLFVQSVWFENMDSDYVERLSKVKASVKEYLSSVDGRMSDLEKVLLAHEYIVNHTNYKKDSSNLCHSAGGPLGNGYGVCDGYAKAMNVLLHEVGIETDIAVSTNMNHSWSYVKLDGSWYHIDATWDDTQKGSNDKYMHRFLIRNDSEFTSIYASRNHYDWKLTNNTAASTSDKYTDWFVHGVAGSMYYYDGMWYYYDITTNSILCSDIEGNITKTIVDGTNLGQIKLNGVNGNVLSYTIGTTQYSRTL